MASASLFERWEKDLFFSAAEEVQESADRMESTYRTWVHSEKDISGQWNSNEVQRHLQTAIGTAKWQLEEFERAVNSSYINNTTNSSKDRHQAFITAIRSQISHIENKLKESAVSKGKPPLPLVHLDKGEYEELATFLLSSSQSTVFAEKYGKFDTVERHIRNIPDPVEPSQLEPAEEKPYGHRRTASAGADIGSWNISVADDALQSSASGVQADPPPRKMPSVSGFLNTMETAAKLKWSKNGYRKLNLTETDDTLPQFQKLAKGITSCYDTSKSCLEGCDECYEKPLYGWYGSLHRQLQRSQYQMQYNRPVQIVFSVILLICIIALVTIKAI